MRIFQNLKNIYHLIKAVGANFWFGFPSRKIKIIGVTGTNGKTTTVQMIGKILEKAGYKVAVNSTINYKIGEREWVNKTKFTTVSAWALQKFIKQAAEAGCEYLVLETSSHALDQNRVWGVNYDAAVITNITREHLDYHVNMENYKNAKLELFSRLNNNFRFLIFNFKSIFNFLNFKTKNGNKENRKLEIENRKSAVVNLDMEWAEEFLETEADEKYGYLIEQETKDKRQKTNPVKSLRDNGAGKLQKQNNKFRNQENPLNPPFEKGEIGGFKDSLEIEKVEAKNIKLKDNKFEFMIGNSKFVIHLLGKFNIENALAAVCAGLSQRVNLEKCAQALEEIKKIPGRMDYVENDRGLNIIIDYALTPDSMEKLGKLMKSIINKKDTSYKRQDTNPVKSLRNNGTGKLQTTIPSTRDKFQNQKNLPNPPSLAGRQVLKKEGNEKNKLIWIFGACGERDRGKRPMMGEIVSRYADVAIVTNEDPYCEDPERIIDEIFSGMQDTRNKIQDTNPVKSLRDNGASKLQTTIPSTRDKFQISAKGGPASGWQNSKLGKKGKRSWIKSGMAGKEESEAEVFKIIDRKEAIKKAIEMAQEGDYILITGKGAEETMAIGKKRVPWNDRKVIESILNLDSGFKTKNQLKD